MPAKTPPLSTTDQQNLDAIIDKLAVKLQQATNEVAVRQNALDAAQRDLQAAMEARFRLQQLLDNQKAMRTALFE
jgi:flagellar biosynthesis chaperone FliJ